VTPGLRIGRYEVGERLGKGGFGVVHLARDHGLGRDVAIKFLRPEFLAREQVVQRFLQEARAAATIGHPGIVTVFECGVVDGSGGRADGTAYIVMERLQGVSLADRIDDTGRFSIGAAIAIGRQLAAALGAAHAAGIIHRDLKPDNIFLVPDAAVVGGERAKILDFGIAKLADPGPGGVHTHSQMILGTPRYMSPEQARSAAKVDARSDIYALGCMLYELVSGKPPFSGDTGDILIHHQSTPAPPPHEIVDGVPEALDRLIVKMLEKDADRRPQTMQEVDDALAAVSPALPQAPVVATPRADRPKRPREVPITTLAEPPVAATSPAADAASALDAPTVPGHRAAPVTALAEGTPPIAFLEPSTLAEPTLRHRRSRRLLIASIIAVLFTGTIVIVLMTQREAVPIARTNTPGLAEPVDASMGDTIDAAIDAAVAPPSRAVTVDVQKIVVRCQEAIVKRDWVAANTCGNELEAADPAAHGKDFVTKARMEVAAAISLRDLEARLAKPDLAAAEKLLATIPHDSVYYAAATSAYDAVVANLVRAAIPDLDRLARARSCDAYTSRLRNLERAYGRKVEEDIRKRARRCDPKGRVAASPCDACGAGYACENDTCVKKDAATSCAGIEEVEAAADTLNGQGKYAAALAKLEQVVRCKPGAASKAYLAACRAKNFRKAKYYFRNLPVSLAQICIKEGFDPRQNP